MSGEVLVQLHKIKCIVRTFDLLKRYLYQIYIDKYRRLLIIKYGIYCGLIMNWKWEKIVN